MQVKQGNAVIRWVLIVVGLLVLGRASDGAEEIVSPDLLTLGWRPVAFPGRVQTRFIGHEDGEGARVTLKERRALCC